MTKAKAKTIIKMGVPDQETINEILAGAGGKYVAVEAFKVPKKNGEFTLRAYRINRFNRLSRSVFSATSRSCTVRSAVC